MGEAQATGFVRGDHSHMERFETIGSVFGSSSFRTYYYYTGSTHCTAYIVMAHHTTYVIHTTYELPILRTLIGFHLYWRPRLTHASLPLPLTCCVIAARTTSCRES
jgi:hypothetical protein